MKLTYKDEGDWFKVKMLAHNGDYCKARMAKSASAEATMRVIQAMLEQLAK